jgi:tetratricopeptide (TPR) repeat protein
MPIAHQSKYPDTGPLLDKLGGLPLALVQAGAYIGATSLTVEVYIKYYENTWEKLMAYQDRYPLQEYAERSVLTTWKMSYEQVLMLKPEAARLLDQWAFLHPGDISYELVERYTQAFEDGEKARELESIATDELSFRDAVGVLAQYSLVNNNEGWGNFSIHAVVHKWSLYNIVDDQARERLCVRAISMVAKSIPLSHDLDDLQAARRLLPHARMVATRHNRMREVAQLELELHQVADFMQEWESSREVESLYLRALTGKEESLGVKHLSTLDTINNLGILYARRGKMKEAEDMYARALRGREETLGAKHTSTLHTIGSLAVLHADQGKLKDAEEMYVRALGGCEELFGANYSLAFNTVNNFGILCPKQGKFEEAEMMYKRALKGYDEALEEKQTSTFDIATNIGTLCWKQGKLKEAEEMFVRALREKEKAFGAKHTSTLNIVKNLGNLYKDQGKVAEAKETYGRAAEGYKIAEGDHAADMTYLREQLLLLEAMAGEAAGNCQPIGQQPIILGASIPARASVDPGKIASPRNKAEEVRVKHRKRDAILRIFKR